MNTPFNVTKMRLPFGMHGLALGAALFLAVGYGPTSLAGGLELWASQNAKAVFEAADSNSDKFLTKEELKTYIINTIKEKLGDSISEKELKKLIEQVPGKVDGYFDDADKDGDDKLSLKEFKDVAGKIT